MRLGILKFVPIQALLLATALISCVGDDILQDGVEPTIRFSNPIDTIGLGENYQFAFNFFDEVGMADSTVDVSWSSSDTSVIQINDSGLATARANGSAALTVSTVRNTQTVSATLTVAVGDTTVAQPTTRSGTIVTTSSYTLTGSFTMELVGNNLLLTFENDYVASDNLPGLYIYLTNNPTTTASAHVIGPVSIFNGAHSYTIPGVGLYDYQYVLYFCKPFNVKVGDGEIN